MWQQSSRGKNVKAILQNVTLWGEDLTRLPGFEKSVAAKVEDIINNGMQATLEAVHSKKIYV